MNKLFVPMAVVMFSLSMASTAFADPGPRPIQLHGCLDAGAGNGGEGLGCTGLKTGEFGDLDPGNHPENNHAPFLPPGQTRVRPE